MTDEKRITINARL